jgi:hypothetical protein
MKIYIDENMPPQLARALNIIQEALNNKENTNIQVLSVVDEFGKGTPDEEWIPKVSGSIVITQDYNIQRTRHQRDLYIKHGVGMIFIKSSSKNGMSFWDFTQLLIKKWDDIRKKVRKGQFPFAYTCTSNGSLKEIE